ncbi:MAG: carbon-nitrogen hydrolase family protein [Calditrichaeota bacterium]|nr:MAG: carbon-nitrogen hydrolase family protein [Calditrichota bacterium]
MPSSHNAVKVATVQAAPVFLNKKQTVEKVCDLISEAAQNGAQLAVFPEVFISGYPDWVWLVPNSKGAILNDLYAALLDNAVAIPDDTTQILCRAARSAGINVVIGVHERNTEASNASLYNTLVYIDSNGNLLGKHRKLIPTGGERMIWAGGDGSTFDAHDTSIGKLGGLICWENYMPLARQAMYNQGVQIYVAPTWDSGASWLDAMRYIAREGGMFVINCCTAMRVDNIPDGWEFKQLYPEGREWINQGNSCIIDPKGNYLAGPARAEETILYAELDFKLIQDAKRMFDVAGHYARPDVFQFAVNK